MSALLLTAIGAWAQVDYTSQMSTSTSTAPQDGLNADMAWGAEAYVASGFSSGKVLYQTTGTLEAGTYEVTFFAFTRIARDLSLSTYGGANKAQAYAIDGSGTAVTQSMTIATNAYIPDMYGWTTDDMVTLTVTLAEQGTIEYGLQNIDTGGQWYGMLPVSLIRIDETATISEGDELHECESVLGDWALTTTPTKGHFWVNTWSTEPGLTQPYLEYWVGGEATPIEDNTIYHRQLKGLPEGLYTVSIDARAFNEANTTAITKNTIYFFAEGKEKTSVDLTTGTDGTYNNSEAEVYGTYTLVAEVDETGTLDIGFTVSGTNSDWLSFKNLSVTYIGTELSYNIGEGTANATCIKAGQEVTISFANCMSADDGATLSATATGTLSSEDGSTETITLTGDGNGNYTFTVPEGLTYSTAYTFTMDEGAVTWTYGGATKFSSPAVNITFTTPEMADQLGVYLLNLGENEFLSRGHSWDNTSGTAADVDMYGLPVDITASSTGGWNIRYIDSNLYIGGTWWASGDAALDNAANFTLVTDGTATDGRQIYRFRNGSDSAAAAGDLYVNNGTSYGPLGLNDDDAGINSTADRQWVIYTKDERDAYKAANVLDAKLATAKALSPSFSGATEDEFNSFIEGLNYEDATSKVGGATLASAEDLDYWTEEDYDTDGTGFAAGSNTIETYVDVDDIYQTITGLEEGIYKVTLQGFNRMGDAAYILANLPEYDISLATLGANDDEINLKTWASDRPEEDVYNSKYASSIESNDSYFYAGYEYFLNSQYQASLIFDDKAYQNELYTYVGDGGSLTITIACPDYLGANWVVFTNMTLTRYYTDDTYVYDVTKMLANPSFEEDVMSGDFTDAIHGAYTASSLTGWTLTAPTGSYAVCDLMTKDATALDNGFTVPTAAADESQWLYVRNAWKSEGASVKQTVTLPAGNYKVAVDNMCMSTVSDHSATLTVADLASASLPISTATPDAWNTTSVKFSLTEETEVTLGVDISFANAAGLSVLLDNFRLYSETDVVEWTLGADYGTLILPFAADVPTGLTAYTAGTVSNNELPLTNAESISANTPYIIGGTTGTYYFAGEPTNENTTSYTGNTLVGTLPAVTTTTTGYYATEPTATTVSEGNYVLQNQDGTTAFYLVDDDTTITCGAYHCYLDGDAVASGVKSITFTFGDDVATRIDAVETEETANEAIYDLSGRRVAKAQKGIYIVNGKKMVIK